MLNRLWSKCGTVDTVNTYTKKIDIFEGSKGNQLMSHQSQGSNGITSSYNVGSYNCVDLETNKNIYNRVALLNNVDAVDNSGTILPSGMPLTTSDNPNDSDRPEIDIIAISQVSNDLNIIEMNQSVTTEECMLSQDSDFHTWNSSTNNNIVSDESSNKIDTVFDNINEIQNALRESQSEVDAVLSISNLKEPGSYGETQLSASQDPMLMVNKQISSPISNDDNELSPHSLITTNEAQTKQIITINETQLKKKDPLNVHQQLLEIRRNLIRLNKQNVLVYVQLKQQLNGMFRLFTKLSKIESLKYNEKNQLSTPFLKLFMKILKCSSLNDSKLHELFKLLINCYIINFKNFTKCDKFQYNLIFQLIFDLIYIHSKVKLKDSDLNLNSSYYLKFEDHKIKNQLTLIDDEHSIQILLYYLIQLLFLTINLNVVTATFNEKQYFSENLRKLMAFLIINANVELLKLFHKNRKRLNTL